MSSSASQYSSSHRRNGRRHTRKSCQVETSTTPSSLLTGNATIDDLNCNDVTSTVSSLSSRSVVSKWHRVNQRQSATLGTRRKEGNKSIDASSIRLSVLLLLSACLMLLQFRNDDNSGSVQNRPEGQEILGDDRRALKSYYASFTHDNSLSAPRSGSGSSFGRMEDIKPDNNHLDQVVASAIDKSSQRTPPHSNSDAQESTLWELLDEDEHMTPQERQESIQFHRMLQEHFNSDTNDQIDIPIEMVVDEEPDTDEKQQQHQELFHGRMNKKSHSSNNNQIDTYSSLISSSQNLPRYNLSSALQQISTYRTAFALLVYDPPTNEFYILYSRKHMWSSAVTKLTRAMHSLTYLLRLEFGQQLERMRTLNRELVIPVSSGDYPLVSDTACVRDNLRKNGSCVKDDRGLGLAPILHFGSVFRRPMFPNMIAMPPPEAHHLNCFEQWAVHTTVCSALRAKSEQDPKGELIYAKEFGIKWSQLKNQVVWRGTDFGYLGFVHQNMKRPSQPEVSTKVQPKIDSADDDNLSRISYTLKPPPSSRMSRKEDALAALKEDYNKLVPRWKGVVLTAEAELALEREIEELASGKNEARRMKEGKANFPKPWANIKFSQFIGNGGTKAKTVGSREYRKWEKVNFPAVGESMSLEELANYKYHIDLGGGGGTTWSGTLHKLAFPGLLMHHVTPTKDYFHDWLQPWKHYVPVKPDLSDLKEKYYWAQSHQRKAFQIARNGSELMRFLSSPKGMEERYLRDILDPLRAVINAYVPLNQIREYQDKTWKEVLIQKEGNGNILPILKCTGESSASCEKIVDKEAFLDRKVLRRFTNAGGFEVKESPPQETNRKLQPWAKNFFVDINKKPDTSRETALFWHIPKSGGTTIKNLYHCTGQTLAHRGGVDPQFGHDQKNELIAFKPKDDRNGRFVNVDTTIKEGILRAKELGLVQSHMSDIIFTMEPTFAGQNLYDKKNKGRILSLFRHPVERMVSKFYYLQIADWERGYRPDWKDISLLEWIKKAELKDDNLITRKLVQKSFNEPIDEADLMQAKAILRRRVIVGLMNRMEESVHRFNIVLGIDESLDNNSQCMNQFFGKSNEKDDGMKNANKHPKVLENSDEWQLLAEKEWLDIRLYAYAEELFDVQKETIYSYM